MPWALDVSEPTLSRPVQANFEDERLDFLDLDVVVAAQYLEPFLQGGERDLPP